MIIIVSISDREKFLSDYAPAASALVEKFGGRYVLRGQATEILEGDLDPATSVVISEWPDKESALRFWNSDEYRTVKALREGISEARVVIVEAPPIA